VPGSFAAAAAGGPAPSLRVGTGTPAAKKQKPKSIVGQLGDVVAGLPAGLLGFGTDIAKTAVAPIRTAVDVAKGDLGGKNLWEIAQREVPAVTQLGTSIAHTGQDIIDPTRFAQAVREGTIVSKVLEDIGNAALIAGPAAKIAGTAGTIGAEAAAAGAGEVGAEAAAQAATRGTGLAGIAARAGAPELASGLESVGRGIRTVGTLGERTGVGQGPAAVFAVPYKALSAVAEKAGLEGGFGGVINRGLARPLATKYLFPLTEAGRKAKLIEGERYAAMTDAQVRAHQTLDIADKAKLTEHDGKVAVVLADQRMAAMRPQLQQLVAENRPELARSVIEGMYADLNDPRIIPDPAAVLDAMKIEDQVRAPGAAQSADRQVRGVRMVLDDLRAQEVARAAREMNPDLAVSGRREGVLDPAQRGDQFLEPQMAAQRREIEAARNAKLRELDRIAPRQAHAERIYNAEQALLDQAKSAATPRAMFARGRAAERLNSVADAAERAAAKGARDLQRLTDEYTKRVLAGDANVQALADQVTALTDRVTAANDAAAQAARRLDARIGLSRATGEMVSRETPEAMAASGEAPQFRTTTTGPPPPVVPPPPGDMPVTVGGAEARVRSTISQLQDAIAASEMRRRAEQVVVPPSPTVLTGQPTVGMQRAIGAEQLRAAQARQGVTQAEGALARGQAELDRAALASAGPATAGEAAAMAGAETRAGTLADIAQRQRTTAASGMDVLAPKAGERGILRQAERVGRVKRIYDELTSRKDSIVAAVERHNQAIGDLPREMARGVQDRIGTFNGRAIGAEVNRLRKMSKPLIDVDAGGNVRGVMGDILRETKAGDLAHKWVANEWADAVHGAATEGPPKPWWLGGEPPAARTTAEARSAFLQRVEESGLLRDMDAQHGMPEGYFAGRLENAANIEGLIDSINSAVGELDAKGLTLQNPRTVYQLIEDADFLPADVRNAAAKARGKWEGKFARTLVAATDDYLKVVPKLWRDPLVAARRGIVALLEKADELDATDPGAANQLRLMAEDVPTTMQELVANGVERPLHAIGGVPRTRIAASLGGAPGGRRTSINRLITERGAKMNLAPANLIDYLRREAENESARVGNIYNRKLADQLGTPIYGTRNGVNIGALDTDPTNIDPAHINEALKERGYVKLDPAAPFAADTKVVPRQIGRMLERADQAPQNVMFKALARTNRAFKTQVLPFSARWHTGNTIGGVIQAMVYGGLNPVELVQRLREAAKESGGWKELLTTREGLTASAPRFVSKRGLTMGEHQTFRPGEMREPRTAFGRGMQRVADRSYRINEVVDNLGKSAVYLQHLREGLPTDAAAHSALKAMGDFQAMSPFERQVVRQVVPFYSWIKHQTTAFMRLPLEHPARAAWVGHLASMYHDDPDFKDWLNGQIPLGGDRVLSIGSVVPIPGLDQIGISPEAITQALAPGIRVPAQIAGFMPTSQPIGVSGAPYHRLADAAYLAAGALPVGKAIRDLTVTPPDVRRYGTGQQTTIKGRRTGRTKLNTLATLAGVWAPQRRVNAKGQYVDDQGKVIR
jgi:hypothetical protein